MKEDKYFEEKISRALEAIKHPENFTDEELRKLLNDTKCLQACRDLLDGKEALARQNATAPDIEKEWSKFSSQHTTQKDIRHKGELNSPDGAPKGKTRNVDTFGRKLSVPAVKRMRFYWFKHRFDCCLHCFIILAVCTCTFLLYCFRIPDSSPRNQYPHS